MSISKKKSSFLSIAIKIKLYSLSLAVILDDGLIVMIGLADLLTT